jgi:hypothetical protein
MDADKAEFIAFVRDELGEILEQLGPPSHKYRVYAEYDEVVAAVADLLAALEGK